MTTPPNDVKESNVPSGLVCAETCRLIVWSDERGRPCMRTFRRYQRQRLIPFVKIGRRTFFDPAQVRAAIDKQFTVQAKGGK